MLKEALTDDVIQGIKSLYGGEATFEIVQLNCALAALRLEEAHVQRDPHLFDVVQQHLDAAKKISRAEMLPDIVQGMLDLAKVSRQGPMFLYRHRHCLQSVAQHVCLQIGFGAARHCFLRRHAERAFLIQQQ